MSVIDTWGGWVKFSNHLKADRYEEAAKMLQTGDRIEVDQILTREVEALNAVLMPGRWLKERDGDWVVEEVELP